jgi:hypothetical protein
MGAGQASIAPSHDAVFIESAEPERHPAFKLTVIHLSCASDAYQQGNDYAGFILYSHDIDGKTDWYLNGKHCKTGYLVIQNTAKQEVQRYKGIADGLVHGPVYMNVFGEDIGNTVGEAFSYIDDTFKWRPHALNTRYPSSYHDQDKEMAEVTKKCVSKILEEWKACEGYLPTCRNYEVKDLLR